MWRSVLWVLLFAVGCFLMMAVVGLLAINPSVGEGADLDPQSFRYQVGVWIEFHADPVIAIVCWPMMLAAQAGVPKDSYVLWVANYLLAGAGWYAVWRLARYCRTMRSRANTTGDRVIS